MNFFGRRKTNTHKEAITNESNLVYDLHRHRLDDSMPSAKTQRRKPRPPSSYLTKLKLVTCLLLAVAIVSGFIGIRLYRLSKIFVPRTDAAPSQLTKKANPINANVEGDGRVNILFMGIGDPTHAGADLSDTMMVLSVDTRTRDVAMLGIPRDLWVNIPGHGYNKINAANALGDMAKSGAGPDLAKQVVSNILGVPIQYFVRTNFSGLKEGVNTLGGITMTVPQSLYDPEYPCAKNENFSCGVTIRAGTYVMNGDVALEYARCRKGNCGNDFGRAKRQQDILLAMKEKALTLPSLVNPAKINNLISILGNNVRTDIGLSELKTFYNLFNSVSTSTIAQNVLDNEQNHLVTTATIGSASTVIPTAGVGNYSAIQTFVRQIFFDGEIKKEAATLTIENDSGKPSTGETVCALLKSYGYNVVSCDNGVTQNQTVLYDMTNGKKPYTLQYLQKRFNLKAQNRPPSNDLTAPVLRLVIGANYHPKP